VRLSGAVEAPAPSTELATISAIPAIVPAEFFKTGGSEDVLARLEQEVRSRAKGLDISTDGGRKAIASLAYQVARSKTALDGAGEKLGEELRLAKEAIDAERRKVRSRCDALKDEVRKPLTDWEDADKSRKAAHEAAIAKMSACAELGVRCRVIDIELVIVELDELWKERSWEEFTKPAETARNATRFLLDGYLKNAERVEAERIEMERAAEEARERAIKEREAAAANAAKDKAEAEAREREAVAQRAAEAARQRIENEKYEAEARAKQAEAARVAAIEQAEQDAKEAERRARVAKAEAESARVAAEQLAERKKPRRRPSETSKPPSRPNVRGRWQKKSGCAMKLRRGDGIRSTATRSTLPP
jgi:colicin import membrane protein